MSAKHEARPSRLHFEHMFDDLLSGPAGILDTVITQQLPDGLATLPPGLELAAVLASIDYSRVVNGDMPLVLRAQARQRAHQEAQLYKAIAEVGFRDPSVSCGQVGYLQAPARYA